MGIAEQSITATRDASQFVDDDLMWKAREDLIAFLSGSKSAIVNRWAYLNGGFKIFSGYQTKNELCSYFHKEPKLLQDHGQGIADAIGDVDTAVIIGAGDAFSIKEEEILKKFKNLKKLVLIDVSPSGNDSALKQAEAFKKKHGLNFEIARIDKDLFDFDENDFKVCQDGITTVIATGGMPLNSPGHITDSKPDAKLKEVFNQVGRIIDFGDKAKNSFMMTHKLPPRTDEEKAKVKEEYTHAKTEYPYFTVQHWLTNCLSHMLKTAEILEHNRDNFEDFDVVSIADYFKHAYSYESRAENARNGLEVVEEFQLNIPQRDGSTWSRAFHIGELFCFFNTIFATPEWLDRVARVSSHTTPLRSTHTFAREENAATLFKPHMALAA